MKTEVIKYLQEPVSRGRALAAMTLVGGGIFIIADTLLRRADDIVTTQKENLAIYSETTRFLMDRADGPTLHELNQNLDYWRVVRGMPVDEK